MITIEEFQKSRLHEMVEKLSKLTKFSKLRGLDYFQFKSYLIKIIVSFSFYTSSFVTLMAVMTGSARLVIDLLFTVILLGSYIFLKKKKESACVINFIVGVTTVCFLLGSQLSPVVLFGLTAILMIISSITLSNVLMIIFYYIINLAYIVISFIISQLNPDIPFYFDESLNNVIIIYTVIFFLSLTISIRLFGTIKYQKQQNEELVKKKQELVDQRNHLDDLVKEKTKELIQSNEDLSDYVYKISHDLKTPIVSISNFISLFLKKKKIELDSSSIHYFNRIEINIEELKKLIDEVLENYEIGNEALMIS